MATCSQAQSQLTKMMVDFQPMSTALSSGDMSGAQTGAVTISTDIDDLAASVVKLRMEATDPNDLYRLDTVSSALSKMKGVMTALSDGEWQTALQMSYNLSGDMAGAQGITGDLKICSETITRPSSSSSAT